MFKIIMLLFLLALLIAGAIYWLMKPTLPFPFHNSLIKSENLTNKIKDKQSDVLSSTYNNLITKTLDVVDNVKEKVYQDSQATLDNIFDKKTPQPSAKILVSTTNEAGKVDKKVLMDLSSTESLKLNLIKGKAYFISFKNTLSGNCLFINNERYELKDGLILKVSFSESGVYKVKSGPCKVEEKDIGELVVN